MRTTGSTTRTPAIAKVARWRRWRGNGGSERAIAQWQRRAFRAVPTIRYSRLMETRPTASQNFCGLFVAGDLAYSARVIALDPATQYAAASRLYRLRLWNTGS